MGEQPTRQDILILIKQARLAKCLRKLTGATSIGTSFWTQKYIFVITSQKYPLPLPFQLCLVGSEPRVGHLLTATRETPPPADAPPAGEAAPADRLAPLGASFGRHVAPRHTAGELLQGTTQRHDGIHHRGLFLC